MKYGMTDRSVFFEQTNTSCPGLIKLTLKPVTQIMEEPTEISLELRQGIRVGDRPKKIIFEIRIDQLKAAIKAVCPDEIHK